LLVAAVSERVLVIYSAMLVRADDAKVHHRRRYSMPQLRRPRRRPKPNRRRALELLASCRDGCTEALLLARGFSIGQAGRARARWPRERACRVVVGGQRFEIARVQITEAGDGAS
jgi:hypothetical protein